MYFWFDTINLEWSIFINKSGWQSIGQVVSEKSVFNNYVEGTPIGGILAESHRSALTIETYLKPLSH